jgi:hypothetical protein
MPGGRQDWYLGLRLRIGYTDPLADCVSQARLSYRISADGMTRRSGSSGQGQTDVAVNNIHVGPASGIGISVTVHAPAGCALTLDPSETFAGPQTP